MSTVTYVRYYFPNVLRWVLSILLFLLAIYLVIIGWYVTSAVCILFFAVLLTFKYVITVDQEKKMISDRFHRLGMSNGTHNHFTILNTLLVTKEKKSYKAATRSRDYWVNYVEYTLSLNYDDNKTFTLLTLNDHEDFKSQVEKFRKELNLKVEVQN